MNFIFCIAFQHLSFVAINKVATTQASLFVYTVARLDDTIRFCQRASARCDARGRAPRSRSSAHSRAVGFTSGVAGAVAATESVSSVIGWSLVASAD